MAKHFNADFYVTCATVIPVLYLAVVVQGRAYEPALRASRRVIWAFAAAEVARPSRLWMPVAFAAGMLLSLAAYIVVIAGALGEAYALVALYQESDHPHVRLLVLLATLLLVTAAAAGPFLAYRDWGKDDDPPGQAPSPGEGETPAGTRPGAPPPGTG
jgi:hypothetical protein